MLSLLVPVALAALVVVPIIYLIHLLFGSRRRVHVPALFLWADLPSAPTGRSRRRWPPLSLLLLLQLLAAVIAAVALARPAVSSAAPQHVALILDGSASMQATDVTPTRFEAARERAFDRLGALTPNDRVTVIRAGAQATNLGAGPPSGVGDALSKVQPGATGAAIQEALALASAQISATPDRRGQIVVFTDAAWPSMSGVDALAAPVEVVAVGGGAENQAVSTLEVRVDPSGRAQTAFVEIVNEADHAVRVPVRLTADDAPLEQRDVDLTARGRTRMSVPLPIETRTLAVRLLGRDALPLDDTLTRLAPGGPPRDVLLLGRPLPSLQRALEAMPTVRLHVADGTADGRPAPDLTVLSGVLPQQLPAGPLLLVNPPANSPRLLGVGLGTAARVDAGHPLLQGLDLAALRSESPLVSGVPGWARVVLGTSSGPLLMEGRLEGRTVVALSFDPTLSGLDKSLAFPLLVSNAARFLLAPRGVDQAEPLDPAELDIRPRAAPTFTTDNRVASPTDGWVERWPWLIGGVLVLLAAEWVVFARRG